MPDIMAEMPHWIRFRSDSIEDIEYQLTKNGFNLKPWKNLDGEMESPDFDKMFFKPEEDSFTYKIYSNFRLIGFASVDRVKMLMRHFEENPKDENGNYVSYLKLYKYPPKEQIAPEDEFTLCYLPDSEDDNIQML
jgi:hypothetical protein